MMEKLREMEVARQEMKRQAFESAMCHKIVGHFDIQSNAYTELSDQLMWDAWQAAQEQMLQETTWNDYSVISPTNEGRYQIFINGEQLAADWIDKFGFADPFDGDALRQGLITHWQPLPQSPKQ